MTTKDEIEALFRKHYMAMYRRAMLILRDADVARDIVHDIFEAILVSNKTDVSGAYLLTAVQNRCLKHIRSLSFQNRIKAIYAISEDEIEEEIWPDDSIITLIRTTISNDLSEACRRVVNLRFVDNKSYEEIAETFGISKVAVYKHLRHAIEVLRKKLSRNG